MRLVSLYNPPMPQPKEVYIIGGPNGAGKTTFVEKYLPNYLDVKNFINADMIARGLSPFDYNAQAIKAGKLMLSLIEEYSNKGISFGFETTLAGKKWLDVFQDLKVKGYQVIVFFLYLDTVELAVQRVSTRVKLGGHDIPEDTIKRRFLRSRLNFWNDYRVSADAWYLLNTSNDKNSGPVLVAHMQNKKEVILNKKYLDEFTKSIEEEPA